MTSDLDLSEGVRTKLAARDYPTTGAVAHVVDELGNAHFFAWCDDDGWVRKVFKPAEPKKLDLAEILRGFRWEPEGEVIEPRRRVRIESSEVEESPNYQVYDAARAGGIYAGS